MIKTAVALLLASILPTVAMAEASTVFITGSDRGIGFQFVRQYAANDWTVIATALNPEGAPALNEFAAKHHNVVVEKLDVTSDSDIRSIANKHAGQPIDILINNAGILGRHDQQTLGTFNRTAFHDSLDVNAFGALAVSEALRRNVILSEQKKIIAIGSDTGSITTAGEFPKDAYYYRMSKAALDMGMRALGIDLKAKGVTVAVVAPGAVRTEMLTTFVKEWATEDITSAMSATESVTKMRTVISKLTPELAERGISNYDGRIIPW